jgi:hypothetical protein
MAWSHSRGGGNRFDSVLLNTNECRRYSVGIGRDWVACFSASFEASVCRSDAVAVWIFAVVRLTLALMTTGSCS